MSMNAQLCIHVHVTIFSDSGKFQLVSNFTELHALTLSRPFLCTLATVHFPQNLKPITVLMDCCTVVRSCGALSVCT